MRTNIDKSETNKANSVPTDQDSIKENSSVIQSRTDNRSESKNISELQELATNFSSNNMEPIQRMVWPIGRDETTESNYNKLVDREDGAKDTTGSLREPTKEKRPLEDLGETEALHLVGHGDGKGHIEGMDAAALVRYLIRQGFTNKHKGTIRLISCLSGTPRPQARLFTEEFKEALEVRGFSNGVIGFNGLVRVTKGASIEVIAPENIPTFEELSPKLAAINQATIRIINPPNRDPSSKAWQQWYKELQRLQAEAKELNVRIVVLWEKQSMDKNMSILGVDQ